MNITYGCRSYESEFSSSNLLSMRMQISSTLNAEKGNNNINNTNNYAPSIMDNNNINTNTATVNPIPRYPTGEGGGQHGGVLGGHIGAEPAAMAGARVVPVSGGSHRQLNGSHEGDTYPAFHRNGYVINSHNNSNPRFVSNSE